MALTAPGLNLFDWMAYHRRDRPMKDEGSREMVLQTTVALLSLGLAVMSLLLMGRWV